jgi:hypothetical protein
MKFNCRSDGHFGSQNQRAEKAHTAPTLIARMLFSAILGLLFWTAPATAGQWGNTARCDQNTECLITEPSMVYYGADVENNVRKYDRGSFVNASLASPVKFSCTDKANGDPAPGVRKECRVVPWSKFKRCAMEGQFCSTVGAMAVAYGQGTNVVPKVTNAGVNCTWSVFPKETNRPTSANYCMAAALEPEKGEGELVKLQAVFKQPAVVSLTNQLQTAHAKFMSYKWRTVYKLEQVPKQNAPGTRLAGVKVPNWTQLDAESYLMTLPGLANLPAFNCQASVFGGAVGRPIQLTMPNGSKVAISDAQINALLVAAFPRNGQIIYDDYFRLKTSFCGAIYNSAQLHFRTQRYNEFKAAQQTCKDDGIQMMGWEYRNKQNFGTSLFPLERTITLGGGMNFKCGQIYKGNSEDALNYESYFIWSDGEKVPVNLIQTILETKAEPNQCPSACIPLVTYGGVIASLCVGLEKDIPITDTIPVKFGAKVRFSSESKEICTPVIYVPAPFGYAQSLSEMGEDGMAQLQTMLMDQLKALMPDTNGQLSGLMTSLSSIASQ